MVEFIRLFFIIKGIMIVDDVLMVVEFGVSVIIVLNYGGRVFDYIFGICEVFLDIVKFVKGKIIIFVDGGVRIGVDVVKMFGLGVDVVLMGRFFVIVFFGGGFDGVEFFIEKIRNELCEIMILIGC